MSYGLTEGVMTWPESWLAHWIQAFSNRSGGVDAELSDQNCASSFSARAGSSASSADQASRAQMAPPEVPLIATTR